MDRRNALKNLLIASGSLIALPSWAKEWNIDSIRTQPSSFSPVQQQTLAAVADTIIPAGKSIGALSVGVDIFLQKLIDNCYDKEVQNNVRTQLDSLEAMGQHAFTKSFSNCDQHQREEFLQKLSLSEIQAEKDFFTLIKSETIRGFSTSKEVMVDRLHYKVAPGHYYGCVDVKV